MRAATFAAVRGAVSWPRNGGMVADRFCTSCGEPRQGESRFCVACGGRFDDGEGIVSRPEDRLRAAGDPSTPASALVTLASDSQEEIRLAATRTIIDLMDTDAMTACGDAALAAGDFERGEFWFMEAATADADETVRSVGIEDLARRVYIPTGRLHEAELYTRNAAIKADRLGRARAERTLADIRGLRIARGPDGLDFDDSWRQVDVSGPVRPGMTQQEHYWRMLAFNFHKDEIGESDRVISMLQSDFMQGITGYILGLARSVAEFGMERETAVKALSDWLGNRDGVRLP